MRGKDEQHSGRALSASSRALLLAAVLVMGTFGRAHWEVVIRGLQPAWIWRTCLGIVGAVAYVGAVVLSARELARAVARNLVSRAEISRLVFTAYWAGGTLLVVAAAFNPISSSLVLLSGVSSGFAAMAGLTRVPAMVERRTVAAGAGSGVVPKSPGWIVAGLVVGAFFVAVVGPGIQF